MRDWRRGEIEALADRWWSLEWIPRLPRRAAFISDGGLERTRVPPALQPIIPAHPHTHTTQPSPNPILPPALPLLGENTQSIMPVKVWVTSKRQLARVKGPKEHIMAEIWRLTLHRSGHKLIKRLTAAHASRDGTGRERLWGVINILHGDKSSPRLLLLVYNGLHVHRSILIIPTVIIRGYLSWYALRDEIGKMDGRGLFARGSWLMGWLCRDGDAKVPTILSVVTQHNMAVKLLPHSPASVKSRSDSLISLCSPCLSLWLTVWTAIWTLCNPFAVVRNIWCH